MFLSIITPTFNSEKYIQKHIDALNIQKKIFEQIIIDKFSEDKTIELIKNRAKYPLRIIQEIDNGIYDAMNKGIKYATGQYYLFLNSDDWIDPDIFDFVEKKIKENPNNDIYYGNTKYFKENKLFFKKKSNKKFLKFTNSISHQATYYKNSIFLKNRYNTKYKISADYDFNLNLLEKKYNFFYLDKFLSNNSLGGFSSNLELSFRDFYSIQKKYNGYLKGILFTFFEYKFKLHKLLKYFITFKKKNYPNVIEK